MKRNLIIDAICALLIILWVYSATSKLFEYERFVAQLKGHRSIKEYASTIAWLVPVVEILIAVLLFLPATKIKGLWASAVLLLIFTGYILYMFKFYDHKPCSCGGVISKLSWRQHIIFNLTFMLITIIGIIANNNKYIHKASYST